ncbi:uncharacterized protein SPAPADRAFT_59688 [Spathaspora passalidarum NRRL Y-27907]|uniref:Phosphatidylinositol N-acetylglucosaminyltransferase GPI3 subunit n=1 Tax=Spathaspora passalidarum (strain NRRL Y-27907 / 11-Y1) TaxID=619300 RepID=G3AHV3_SPAPN|nr:uncharacterized protein SPAPADRAFT_59688 [Spathaspora passalidarum NRRL Y-27907]EGW34268.1 hypothetical protein SPAPADRAFT_59688 [Spathaspora passalidarum NRRL Y-27907]
MGYNIAMVSDFFYPQPGGVEFHVYHLSQKLIDMGHSVIIITHHYGNRTGIRTLTNGLKVYYIPFFVLYRSSTFPTVFSLFPILRNIFIREEIDIVHGHGTFSSIGHEAIFHARTMGMRTVFTDHSLFGFADVGSILGNKVLKFTLSDVGHVICVSHTCKENTVLRASLDPLSVSVIPNAVISKDFSPDLNKKQGEDITIVVITRLFPNKGADLLTAIIPRICMAKPNVKFLIAGDGPKFLDLEQMREEYFLQERVKLIGAVKHEQVRDVMVQGDIYLHPSLTEAFGTVIVEAASCGLFVVTTKVGGIPEVLPKEIFRFAEPEEDSLVDATLNAIDLIQSGEIDTSTFHSVVSKMYSWSDIAKRTENVYNSLDLNVLNQPLIERLQKYYCCGVIAGKLYVLCVIVDIFIYAVLEWFYPREHIDRANKWPKHRRNSLE